MKMTSKNLSWMAGAILVATTANAQLGRGGPVWTTASSDMQRDSWIRGDDSINAAAMAKPGFVFLWKQKLGVAPAGKLSEAVMMQTFIGYRGFKQLTFLAGSGNVVYAVDYDLGTSQWSRKIAVPAGTAACTTAGVAAPGRLSPVVAPAPSRGGLGAGARAGYHSSNGKPGEGAPSDATGPGFGAPAPRPATTPGAPAAPPAIPPAMAAIMAPGGAFGKPVPVYFISSDGVLHGLGQSNGKDVEKPTAFVPAGSSTAGIALVGTTVYAATLPGCAGANQVFAMDADTKAVTSWKADGAITGAPAMASTGKLYVAAGKTLSVLEPKSLSGKTLGSAPADFVSAPVIFKAKEKEIVAVGTADSKVVLMDAASGEVLGSGSVIGKPTSLASWEDASGTRWILVVDTKAAKGSVQALKLSMDGSKASLSEGWKSPELDAPATPAIVNDVVFALAKGSAAKPAMLYAMEGTTGKKLWDSGKSVTSRVSGGLSSSNGQVYFSTVDSTLYAFGYPQERQ